MSLPTKEEVLRAKENSPWDWGNNVLYELCRKHAKHDKDGEILAKVWLIGRAYSVAVERRKNKKLNNDSFYTKKIVPLFKEAHLDNRLKMFFGMKSLLEDNLREILKIHHELTELLNRETNLNKRSFSSKYLHFHFPDLFFLYDTRAVTSLRTFVSRVPKHLKYVVKDGEVDKEYSTFFCKCYFLREQIRKEYELDLTPRQLDNLLIGIANKAI